VPAQRAHRERIGARRAPEPEVDAARVDRLERADLLGDDEWRVVGQHDAARAHADRRGVGRDVAHEHDRRRARDALEVVVLGDPVAVIAEPLRVPREIPRGRERLRERSAVGIVTRSRIESGVSFNELGMAIAGESMGRNQK
jgi:hypothetical protein